MAAFDPSRLYSTLLNTGLQTKDNPTYQVIRDLIGTLSAVNTQLNTVVGSTASVTNITQQIYQLDDSDVTSDEPVIPPYPPPVNFANPTALVGLTTVNGSLTTFMR